MDREVSHIVELAVTLIAIASLITVVLFTVTFGKSIESDTVNWLSDSNRKVSEGVLSSINGVPTELPSAGAYNILKTYSSIIEKTECHIDGCNKETIGLNSEPCIATHLKGKVSLDVRKSVSGFYTVEIHEESCKWFNGTCTCN